MKAGSGHPNLVMLLLLLTVLMVPLSLFASAPAVGGEKKIHSIPEVTSKIKIDGELNEEAWKTALKFSPHIEVSPGENIESKVKTDVFLACSSTHFYVAFYCYDDNPSSIRARYSDRDGLWNDDWVAVVLDTFSDHRHLYTFFVNPLGVQADLIETISGRSSITWDALWESAGKIVKDGYVVEISFPLAAMRIQKVDGPQVWGIDLCRNYPRELPYYIGLFPRPRNNNAYGTLMTKVSGFDGAKPSKNIEITPSVSLLGTQEREEFLSGDFKEKDSKIDPGITVSWGVTPNMTLHATVNPDFSQVEADVAQLDINKQFALYYPEKRPFFLEGGAIFETRLPIVHTRTLADPDWGVKLIGKHKEHDIGFYSVQDNITNFLLPGSYGSENASMDMKSVGTVLRYRRDIGRTTSTVGALITDREAEGYHNRLAGLDTYLRLSGSKEIRAQFLFSDTKYPEQLALGNDLPMDKLTGTALDFVFRHSSRNFIYQGGYQQISPDFRADLGFIPQVGFRNFTALMTYYWFRNPGHWYTVLSLQPVFEYEVDFDDNLIFNQLTVEARYKGPLQSDITLRPILGKRSFYGEKFDVNRLELDVTLLPSRAFVLLFEGSYGDEIDYSNARGGTKLLLNPAIVYKHGKHLSITLDHAYERMEVDSQRLYTANVTNLKLVYQFNRRAFLRTIFQYTNNNFNPDNYLFPIQKKDEHLFSQILFSYKLNARTVFFLGYSDDYYGYRPFVPLTQTNRTLFLKVAYALRI